MLKMPRTFHTLLRIFVEKSREDLSSVVSFDFLILYEKKKCLDQLYTWDSDNQGCGTVTIIRFRCRLLKSSGSGSDFRQVTVPFPVVKKFFFNLYFLKYSNGNNTVLKTTLKQLFHLGILDTIMRLQC
jgi:hypothetical protein